MVEDEGKEGGVGGREVGGGVDVKAVEKREERKRGKERRRKDLEWSLGSGLVWGRKLEEIM